MSSKMTLGGRTYIFGRQRELTREPITLPIPGGEPENRSAWQGPYGLVYRIMDHASFEEGWIDAATFAEWFKLPLNATGAAGRAGVLDCAIVRGSQLPLFRVRDAAKAELWARRYKTSRAAAKAGVQ